MTETITQPPALENQTQGVRTLLGNPRKALFHLSVPMIVAMSVQTLYNFIDALWVSGLGADALSAVGFFFPFFFMLMSLATGLGVGGGAAISRRIGAGDKTGADLTAAHTCVLMLITAGLVAVPLYIAAPHIFAAMGAGSIAPAATSYARVLFAGTLLIFFSNVASSLMRAEGDVNRAMLAMMLGAVLNIGLDPVFIYWLGLGVNGAAWATLISLTVSCLLLFYWLCIRKVTFVDISLRRFRFRKAVVSDIARVGIPTAVQHLAMSLAVFLFNLVAVRVGGTDGVAVLTTGWRVAQFAVLPLLGMATAVTSITGAAFGGGDFRKLNTAFMYAVKIGVIVEIPVALATYLLARPIAGLFTMTPDALRIRQDLVLFLQTMCLYYPTTAMGVSSSALFQGTGKGLYALFATLFRTLVLAAPLTYVFAVSFDIGLGGVWWGIVAGNVLGGVVAFSWARRFVGGLLKRFSPAPSA